MGGADLIRLLQQFAFVPALLWLIGCAGADASPAFPSGTRPAGLLGESAMVERTRAMIAVAWEDSLQAWDGTLGPQALMSSPPKLSFVDRVTAEHCFGLYAGTGPVYCTGNNTVFVDLTAIEQLRHDGTLDDPGIVFLIGHELAHHVQKITGRFRMLSTLIRNGQTPAIDFIRRYELEADCLAGMWIRKSRVYAENTSRFSIASAVEGLGDDRPQIAALGTLDPEQLTHGTSAQRRRWFLTGMQATSLAACDVLRSTEY